MASSNEVTVFARSPSRKKKPVEFDPVVEGGIEIGMHAGCDAAHARPARKKFVPAGGELVHVVGHLDLPRQGRRERDQQHRVLRIMERDHRHGGEYDRKADDAAGGTQALSRHDRLDLGIEAVA
jgi:hypothetical protein